MSDSPFYLKPKTKWEYGSKVWFENRPVGWDTLSKQFKEMCQDTGLMGNYSNHSGKVTAATHLYNHGVPENAIMK